MSQPEQRHTIAVLVDNEPGVLARVIGLFSGRGYNIDSLTVAEVDRAHGRSRINIVTTGTAQVIEQIKALLDKLVPVHKVADLTVEGPCLERELALVKVTGEREKRVQALRIADFMHAPPGRQHDRQLRVRDHGLLGGDRRLHRLHGAARPRRGQPRRRGRDRPRRPNLVTGR